MFDPEKLLGGLIRSSTGGRRASRLFTGGAAMGLLGVAIEAAEHYLANQQTAAQSKRQPGRPPTPPPREAPPPPPGALSGPPPTPEKQPISDQTVSSKSEGDQRRAILLIRAMIAAAYADGDMDAQERKRIAQKLRAVETSEEEKRFLARELKSPAALPEIAAQVDSRQLAMQVYAVSRLTIDPDTRAERGYLERLARALDLDARTIQSMEAKLGPLVTAGRSASKGE